IEATMRTFLRAGDDVLLPQPSWPVFRRRLEALEARIVEVPLSVGERSYAYDVARLASSVTEKTKLMIVCTPNNTTGHSMAGDEVRRCAEAAPLVLVDAAYADFDPDVDLTPLVHEYDNIVLSRTF